MELAEIRKNIDRIDSQMLDLLLERLDCSEAVAEIKKLSARLEEGGDGAFPDMGLYPLRGLFGITG